MYVYIYIYIPYTIYILSTPGWLQTVTSSSRHDPNAAGALAEQILSRRVPKVPKYGVYEVSTLATVVMVWGICFVFGYLNQ